MGEREREAQALQGKAIMRPESGWCKEVFHFREDRDRCNSFGGRESGLNRGESGGAFIRADFVDLDGLRNEMLVFFGGSGKQERVGVFGVALHDFGDDGYAAQPVRFLEISCGPARGMTGVGVIKAGDLDASAASFMRDLHQLRWCDLVAVVW